MGKENFAQAAALRLPSHPGLWLAADAPPGIEKKKEDEEDAPPGMTPAAEADKLADELKTQAQVQRG